MSVTGLILTTDEGDHVEITYEAATSGTEQQAEGVATNVSRGLWAKFETDSGDKYAVYGSEIADREKGEVCRNGRKVGTLT